VPSEQYELPTVPISGTSPSHVIGRGWDASQMMPLAFQIRRVCLKLVRHPGSTIALVALTAVGLSVAISVSRLYMTILDGVPNSVES